MTEWVYCGTMIWVDSNDGLVGVLCYYDMGGLE